jgi:hypothetical protein
MTNRREVLKIAASAATGLALPTSFADNQFCPQGQSERVKIWNDYIMVEGQVNAGKAPLSGSAGGKVPLKVIRWEITCESAPKPPPEPPKPPPKNGLYDSTLYMIGESWGDDWTQPDRPELMYFNVGLPSFVGMLPSSASVTLEATLRNGTKSTLVAPLIVDGGGFVYAAPASVSQFWTNVRSNMLSGTLAIDNVMLGAGVAGSGNFGIGAHYAGKPVFGSTGLVFATQPLGSTSIRVNQN